MTTLTTASGGRSMMNKGDPRLHLPSNVPGWRQLFRRAPRVLITTGLYQHTMLHGGVASPPLLSVWHLVHALLTQGLSKHAGGAAVVHTRFGTPVPRPGHLAGMPCHAMPCHAMLCIYTAPTDFPWRGHPSQDTRRSDSRLGSVRSSAPLTQRALRRAGSLRV